METDSQTIKEEIAEDKKRAPLQNIRTIKTDISEIMRKGKTSLTQIYLKQKSDRSIGNGNNNSGNKNLLIYGVAGVILIVAVVGFVFFFRKENPLSQKTVSSENQQPPRAILTSPTQIVIEAPDKESLEKKAKQAISATYKIGDLIYLPVKKFEDGLTKFADSKEFLQLLNAEPPELITQYLSPSFYFGIISLDKNYPVLILETDKKEYESTLVGMMEWEKQLPDKLSFILQEKPATYESWIYRDEVIKNQNARVAEAGGKTILIYSIFNKKYIIITTGQKGLEEIIKELTLFKL